VLCVAFTTDGKQVLTGGFDEPIRLWNAATGKEVRQFPKRSEFAARMAFAPGGKIMAVAHWVHNGLTAAPATHDYFHGEKVAYGLLVQLVLEGQPRSVMEQVLHFSTEVGLPTNVGLVHLRRDDAGILRLARRVDTSHDRLA
jgi:hypothetical protein